MGDLVQAGAIYAGINWFQFGVIQFASFNMVLAAIWLLVAWHVARHYRGREQQVSESAPPVIRQAPAPRLVKPGQPFEFSLPRNCIEAAVPGDVLTFTVRGPSWLRFDAESLSFRGTMPESQDGCVTVALRATNFEGSFTEIELLLTPH
jgi:hypothetical protein